MERKSQRGGGGAREARCAPDTTRRFEEPHDEEADEPGVGSVDQDIGQVIAAWIHAPDEVVDGKREPRHGNPVALVKAGEHPAELRRSEAAPGAVRDEIRLVVPGQEAAVEGGKEDETGQRGDSEGDQHAGESPLDRPRDGSRHRGQRAAQSLTGSASSPAGSTRARRSWAPQCRCGPVARPVLPTAPMVSPRSTRVPSATCTRSRCM